MIRDYSHCSIFADEPDWCAETLVAPEPDEEEEEPDLDDEPTMELVLIEAMEPGECHTVVCAVPPPPGSFAQGSGLMRRVQDPSVMYSCGRTYAEHRAIAADAIRRHAEFDVIAPQHCDELQVHLGQCTCPGCGSTFSWPLPGHREDLL